MCTHIGFGEILSLNRLHLLVCDHGLQWIGVPSKVYSCLPYVTHHDLDQDKTLTEEEIKINLNQN